VGWLRHLAGGLASHPVSQLPSWAGAKRVAIDLETTTQSSGPWAQGCDAGAKVVGISFAIEDGPAHYLPIGHPEDNLDPDHVWAYLRDQSRRSTATSSGPTCRTISTSSGTTAHVPKVKKYRDVQIADPLINELHESYSLDNIAARLGLPGKDESVLRQGAEAYNVDPKKGMWQLPARFVGDYAIQDVRLPLRSFAARSGRSTTRTCGRSTTWRQSCSRSWSRCGGGAWPSTSSTSSTSRTGPSSSSSWSSTRSARPPASAWAWRT
jgi:hypothetical protein